MEVVELPTEVALMGLLEGEKMTFKVAGEYSDGFRTVIPIHAGHPFRSIPIDAGHLFPRTKVTHCIGIRSSRQFR
jgi:hypothetical protein